MSCSALYVPEVVNRYERVLALDVGITIVRGIVLTGAHRTIAHSYAQLRFGAHDALAATVRVARALDVTATLRVVVTCDGSSPGLARHAANAVIGAGFRSATVVERSDTAKPLGPDGARIESLVGSVVEHGLLASHEGLSLQQLEPVIGAGLRLLRFGVSIGHDSSLVIDLRNGTQRAGCEPADPFTRERIAARTAAIQRAETFADLSRALAGGEADEETYEEANEEPAPTVFEPQYTFG